eukprot:g7087.t1
MVSISPNKNKGGGGGKVPYIGRALYEKYGNNGDALYKKQMLKAERLLRAICDCYEYDEDGLVDWREILCVLQALEKPPIEAPEVMEVLQYWWEVWDVKNTNKMRFRPDFINLITTASMCDWDYEFICGLATRVLLLNKLEIANDGFKTLNPSIPDIEKLHPGDGIIEYDDVFKALYSHMGKKLVGELRRQLWQRNPENKRLGVIDARILRQGQVGGQNIQEGNCELVVGQRTTTPVS